MTPQTSRLFIGIQFCNRKSFEYIISYQLNCTLLQHYHHMIPLAVKHHQILINTAHKQLSSQLQVHNVIHYHCWPVLGAQDSVYVEANILMGDLSLVHLAASFNLMLL